MVAAAGWWQRAAAQADGPSQPASQPAKPVLAFVVGASSRQSGSELLTSKMVPSLLLVLILLKADPTHGCRTIPSEGGTEVGNSLNFSLCLHDGRVKLILVSEII